MAVTVLAAWYVASTHSARRRRGFWLYLMGNVLWVGWGLQSRAYALIALQVCLAVMNIRGERKTRQAQADSRNSRASAPFSPD